MTRLALRRFALLGVAGGIGVLGVLGFAHRAAAEPPPPPPAATSTPGPPAPTTAPTPPPTTPSAGQPATGIQVGPSLPTVPTTPGPGPAVNLPGSGGCGFFDVTCHITAAINGWFRDLVTSALNPVLDLMGRTVLATPDLTGGKVSQLWGITAGVANAIVVLFVLTGGAIVMARETLQTRYAAKDLAPRIVLGVIAANASLAVIRLAIPAANSLSQALLGGGLNPTDATDAMRQLVVTPLGAGGIFLVLLGLVAAVLAVVLLGTYVIRVALLVLLAAAAPLALICHCLPQTERTARLWWRAMAGLFAIQLAQTLVLICALKVFFTPDGHATLGLSASGGLVDVLVAICLLWVLVRIPSWVARAVFAGSGHRPSTLLGAVKVGVVYKLVRAGMAALA